jgi:hypothetical protein
LVGVIALIDATESLTTLGAIAASSGGQPLFVIVAAVPMALLGALAYVLIVRGERLAQVLAPDTDSTATAPGARELAPVLVALLGVYILVAALPGSLAAIISYRAVAGFSTSTAAGAKGRLLGYALQIAVALFLALRPERVLAMIQHAEPAPHD